MRRVIGWSIPLLLIAIGLLKRFISTMPWMFVAPLTWCVGARVLPGSAVGMRIVFAGTPEPALPSLRRLIDSPRHEVIAVLTRPDAAAGRRAKPSPSPVAQLALEHGIPVLRPPRPNSDEFVAELIGVGAGVLRRGRLRRAASATAAGGARATAGSTCTSRCCPHGAAPRRCRRRSPPVTTVTGATTFQIEPALDSGPVYGVVTETIRPTDTAGDLLERLSISGAALLETTLDGIADGALTRGAAAGRRRHRRAEDHRRGGPGAVGRCPRTSSSGGSAPSRRTRARGR